MYRQQRHTPTQPSQAKKHPQSTHISSSAAIHKVLLNFNLPIAAQTHPCTNLSSFSHRAIIIWNVYAIKTDRIEAETLCQFTNNMLYVEHVFFCQINSHFKSSDGDTHTQATMDGAPPSEVKKKEETYCALTPPVFHNAMLVVSNSWLVDSWRRLVASQTLISGKILIKTLKSANIDFCRIISLVSLIAYSSPFHVLNPTHWLSCILVVP